MMKSSVVIIGAGVSGLTLAMFLRTAGIPCVVLERRDRAYVAARQRAGVVEARGVRMFEHWNLADKLLAGPVAMSIDYRVNGVSRVFEVVGDDGSESRFCTQQMLVNNLLKELADADLRFSASDIEIHNEARFVTYTDASGSHELQFDYIVGCDGDRGVSRTSIPDGVLTKYSHEFGYAWLAALVEAPHTGPAIMAISDHGCVARVPRGPTRSRYYLQCALTDQDWPDERLWREIRARVGDASIPNAAVLDKFFVPLRCVVYAPMRYQNLFLAGDAAHLVPPASAKGMNLALYDVDILAQAFVRALNHGDTAGLDSYSDTVLPRIWNYQDFSVWMTDMMHDAGDPTQHGTFRQMTARARLDNLFASPTAARLHSEYMRGTN